jgi:hypothetical protein
MKKFSMLILFTVLLLNSCNNNKIENEEMSENHKLIVERIEAYAPVEINTDMTDYSERQRKMLELLVEAGKITDEIFWQQSAPCAISVRDSLSSSETQEAKDMHKYVMINYGPYDVIHGNKRFVGNGPDIRPQGGGFYPSDMTKEEFENFVQKHPELKEEFESQYTVIIRENDTLLKAVPYHVHYNQVIKLAEKIEEAASFCDNPSLKKYLTLRAEAIRTDDYLESDMHWMDLENNEVDIVIGPIENYEDEIFNYKTAYEAVVMVKNKEITKDIAIFKSNMDDLQKNLPVEEKYKSAEIMEGNVIQAVDVVYFGGDCQKGIKTIAAALPNDPRVAEAKGRKNSMYINHIEAKFDKIVIPIGQQLLDNSIVSYVDKKAFTRFVTLHEISHSLGMRYVADTNISVRKALKERYSPIEETKADILSMYNHKYLNEIGIISDEELKQSIVTYLAGMYRSIRFGHTSAHGRANMIQLNYLREKGAVVKQEDDKFNVNFSIFFDVAGQLAKEILEIQGDGDYERAGNMLDKYSKITDEIKNEINTLSEIPRDIDTKYTFKLN